MSEAESPKDPQFVTALARGLEVLRCFTPERLELGTTEIGRLTGLPQSTVWRLCYTLSNLGYLVPGSHPDRLRVSASVLLLGHAAVSHAGLGEFALPLMKRIADEFGAAVSIAEPERLQMVIVQRSEARNILSVNLHIGSALPMAGSSLGWAYLAALDDARRRPLLERLRKAQGEDWAKVRADIDAALADYQRLGCVFNLGKSHREINAIGVPAISPDGQRIVALTCGGARSSLTRETLLTRVAPALRELAARIGPLIGTSARG